MMLPVKTLRRGVFLLVFYSLRFYKYTNSLLKPEGCHKLWYCELHIFDSRMDTYINSVSKPELTIDGKGEN